MTRMQEIKSKKTWEDFLLKVDFFPLFQSWNWGEVEKKVGRKILRIGLLEDGKLIGVCLIVEVKARRGHYLHLRHGPVLLKFNNKRFDTILDFVKKEAVKKGASFIRISPFIKKNLIENNFFRKRGFLNAPIHNMDAQLCLVLNITKSEEELLKEMRKTHRYLIRKAQNLNIKIIRTIKMSDIERFLDLYYNLAKRRGFVPHLGLKEEFEIFVKDDQAMLFLAEFNGRIISGAIILFVDNMAIYHHGASLDEFRDIPTSYLLQWYAILEAKKREKRLYNFWGVAPLDKPSHPWKGITLFKTGFGGERIEFIHAQDLPLNIFFWKTYLIELLTRWRKGY